MKVTLLEVQAMKDPLTRLIAEKIPMISAFKLNKLVRAIEENLELIETSRIKLVQDLGEAIEGQDDAVGVPPQRVPEFNARFNEFLAEEVEIEFTPMNIEIFGDAHITASDVYILDKLFAE